MTNAGELSNNEVVKKNNDYFVVTKAEPQEKINLILEKTIEAQTLGSEFETFEEQFTQLE